MRTLTTSFENALKKDTNRRHAYIFRIEAEEISTGDDKVFYFSDNWDEVDYTAVTGIISSYGTIKQTIDFYNNSYSHGGFDLSVQKLQDKISTVLGANYVIGRKVEIYYWIEGQDKRTNQDMTFDDARLVANSNILDGATDFEIEVKLKLPTSGDANIYETIVDGNAVSTYMRFRIGSSYLQVKMNDGVGDNFYLLNYAFAYDTDYLLRIVKVGTSLQLYVNGSVEDTETCQSGDAFTFRQIGNLGVAYTYSFNGTLYNIKIWSGGDRNTGTQVLDLVGKDDAPLDLTGNYTFTKYVSGAGDITYTDNLQRMYKGIIKDKLNGEQTHELPIGNDTTKLDAMIPPLIDDSDAGDANGKVAQYVYGSHATNYGTYDSRQKNNMVKCHFCGIVDNKYRWIVAGNGSDITMVNAWFYDSGLKRFVKVKSYSNGTDTQGNRYIEITPQDGYITDCYDYIYGKAVSESGTVGSPEWGTVVGNEIEKAIDNDNTSYASCVWLNQAVDRTLKVSFNETNDNTISNVYAFYSVQSTNETTFVLQGSGFSDIDISSRTIYNEQLGTITSIPPYLNFEVTETSGANEGSARVYYAYIRAEYEMTEMMELYAHCINGDNTQREIIDHISDDAGITYTDNTDVTACTIAPVLSTQKKAIDWIREVAFQGACVPYVNNDNVLTIDYLDVSASADKTLYPADIQVGSLKVDETSISDLVNDIYISYYDDNYSGGLANISTSENTTSQNKYNLTKEKTIEADMYTANPTTLKAYWVNGGTETAFTKKRAIVDLVTCGIVGSLPYDGSGNFHPLIELEAGNHVSLDDTMDDYKLCNDESWNGKVFKIIEYFMGVGFIRMKLLEVN